MKKKEKIDFITNGILLLVACSTLLLPTIKVDNIKLILTIILSFYALLKLIQFIMIFKEKDLESLFTSVISAGCLVPTLIIELNPKNVALILLIWMGLMSLVKLKKADFYHDRENKMWILRLFMLFVFLTSGLLSGMNLFYESSVQIIMLGYFFFVNSMLDTIDPIVLYLIGVRK